jgi:hypothetical protein
MKVKIVAIILLVFALTSCSKDKQTLTDNSWEVQSFKVHADSASQYQTEYTNMAVVLSFPSKKEYSFKKEANGCQGNVSFASKDKINFKDVMCTEICCDSRFADNCLNLMINSINHYTINDNNLVLTGNNGETINFVKQ